MPIMLERQAWLMGQSRPSLNSLDKMNHALSDDRPRSSPAKCISLRRNAQALAQKGGIVIVRGADDVRIAQHLSAGRQFEIPNSVRETDD